MVFDLKTVARESLEALFAACGLEDPARTLCGTTV